MNWWPPSFILHPPRQPFHIFVVHLHPGQVDGEQGKPHGEGDNDGQAGIGRQPERQFLAFIHLYRQLHRQGPAETDLVKFFGVTPPSVHGMVVKLEELGLVTRERGVPRSVRVAVPEEEIPPLEDVAGQP